MTSVRRTLHSGPPWIVAEGPVSIHFLGKNSLGDLSAARREIAPRVEGPAYLSQIHSARVVEAMAGHCGRGDALWTARSTLALGVRTADCLPIAIAAENPENRLALVHCGWRGLVAGVIAAAVDALGSANSLRAYIGPGIGPCCYEVGEGVAVRLVAASDSSILGAQSHGMPHVDLAAAAEIQLWRSGATTVQRIGPCTSCSSDVLWSYRREGAHAGRNLTLAWLVGPNRAD